VYDQINADLLVAVANLPDAYSTGSVSKVRATKGAANALLAKAWAQRTDRDYTEVLKYTNAVITGAGGYSLLASYDHLFDGAHDYNAESILEVPYEAGNWSASSWGIQLYLAPEDGWQKYCVPSKDLVAAFDAQGDLVRKNANIIFMKKDANGDPIAWPDENWNPCQDPTIGTPFNYKAKNPGGWASGDNYYFLRLGDIILLKAEAQNETGATAAAITTLNTIRARVGLAALSTSMSKAEAKTAILNERRLELAFEAQRWDDLVRAGVATTTMLALNEVTYTCVGGKAGPAVKMDYSKCNQSRWIYPIPQLEMDANPNLKQNPGY
jgi:hypothetical protein